ncbi:MAG: hypothetical protein H8E32_06710 [Nitrospinae bacterium]|nr:hypothetical protein [Nitrospinota bacterium]
MGPSIEDANFPSSENGKGPWTKEQFITMMKQLTTSKTGFLIYRDLCMEMGIPVVNAFIDHNLLHLRPSSDFAYDLPEFPEDVSVVTAETPSSLIAMKRILEEIDKGKL